MLYRTLEGYYRRHRHRWPKRDPKISTLKDKSGKSDYRVASAESPLLLQAFAHLSSRWPSDQSSGSPVRLVQQNSKFVLKNRSVWLCICFALATAIFPVARAFSRTEVEYNEGWNVYNASLVANHQLLYPLHYRWTSVNYPMLSFVLLAQLHRLTHDYLYTARVVSLLSLLFSSVLVSAIVLRLTRLWSASAIAGGFCLALFCTDADMYVGMDDPQLFAQLFFLSGLLIYILWRGHLLAISGVALIFVIGACIKHNLLDFPLVILIDLILLSPRRAAWFSGCGLFFASIALALNFHYGGPFFFEQLLAPRGYSIHHVFEQLVVVLGPVLFPLCVAFYVAFAVRNDEERRIAAILLTTSLAVDGYFSGGGGVSINALFSVLIATAILIGLLYGEIASGRMEMTEWRKAVYSPLLLFGWLIIPLLISGNWNLVRSLRETAAAEKRFDQEVSFLESRNGPALCESLLRCYFAGKPYDYDPYNATRFIRLGKLDAAVMVEDIRRQNYGAIQLNVPLHGAVTSERFDSAILAAIEDNYVPMLEHKEVVIYVPKR